MQNDLFATEQTSADSEITLPGTDTLPTNPFKDGREMMDSDGDGVRVVCNVILVINVSEYRCYGLTTL
jgi:hypothetical protein